MGFFEIFDQNYWATIFRLMLNLAAVFVLGRFIYYPRRSGTPGYLFTYIATSTIIFVVCILLSQVKVELGIALGLFAVFSVIRFRTIQASPRELSFLFVSLGLALMNALLPHDTPFIRLVVNNLLILAIIWFADHYIFLQRGVMKEINYDRPELMDEAKRSELEEDLKTRFGIRGITKIQMGNIDSLKGRVKLRVWIRDPDRDHFQE